jgi:hypothetical protein
MDESSKECKVTGGGEDSKADEGERAVRLTELFRSLYNMAIEDPSSLHLE